MRPELITFADLVEEQEAVQAEKFQGRMLSEYDHRALPTGRLRGEEYSSAVTDFLVERSGAGHHTIPDVLHGMSENKEPGQKVHWVDMGAGRALAQRQVASLAYARDYVDTTAVDLFDYPISTLKPNEISFIETRTPGATTDAARPHFIYTDVQTVELPQPADLITMIEVVQYSNDPLRLIANCYNQLTDGGLMVIGNEIEWASWIRYDSVPTQARFKKNPMADFLDELSRAGIDYAITLEAEHLQHRDCTDSGEFRNLAIQKRANTELQVLAPVTDITEMPEKHYKFTQYGLSTNPVVQVIRTADHVAA